MSVNSVRVMVGLASPPLEVDAWLAIGRRPLGRRLSPRAPLRVRPRRRDRAEHEACLPLRELHARALLPMSPPAQYSTAQYSSILPGDSLTLVRLFLYI